MNSDSGSIVKIGDSILNFDSDTDLLNNIWYEVIKPYQNINEYKSSELAILSMTHGTK